jgi:hypothetical protein
VDAKQSLGDVHESLFLLAVIFEEEWMDDLDNVEQRDPSSWDKTHQLIGDVVGVVDTQFV